MCPSLIALKSDKVLLKLRLVLFVMPLACLLLTHTAAAQAKEGTVLGFVNLIHSPRANGLGSCTVDLVSEESGLYNPAGVGLFHLDNTVAISRSLNTNFIPLYVDNYKLYSGGVSLGASLRTLHCQKDELLNIAFGFAFSRMQSTTPEFYYLNDVTTIRTRDRVDCYSFAFAADYLVRAGIGYTVKRYSNTSSINGGEFASPVKSTGGDIGFTCDLPLWKIPRSKHPSTLLDPPPSFEVTPRLSYVIANRSDGDAWPQKNRAGISLHLKYRSANTELLSLNITEEFEKDHYSDDKLHRWGAELGMSRFIFLRFGHFKETPERSSSIDVGTFGIGFSSQGLLSYIGFMKRRELRRHDFWGFLMKLDLRFDYASYDHDVNQFLSDMKFYKFSLVY